MGGFRVSHKVSEKKKSLDCVLLIYWTPQRERTRVEVVSPTIKDENEKHAIQKKKKGENNLTSN